MRILDFNDTLSVEDALKRPAKSASDLERSVRPIIDAVRQKGDDALLEFTRTFDGVDLSSIAVPVETMLNATSELPQDLRDAIDIAAENIHRFHHAQTDSVKTIETSIGVTCWRKSIAIERVGLYVPGGTAPLFSTLLMLAIPAKIAGCERIVVCTPPDSSGMVHPAILHSALRAGVNEVFAVGGAQAIAAMAFGTQTVPAVDKIFGPGNAWVTAAKQIVSVSGVAIDLPAGPSEVAVVADDHANPHFVAADLLAQAEHGLDSQVLLVTNSIKTVNEVQAAVVEQLAGLPRRSVAEHVLQNSAAILVSSLDEAMDVVNRYAPEHLILNTENALALSGQVKNAGSVFIGALTPESAGDYASGTNHTLPTAGAARAFSGVSLDSFVKKITFQEMTREGLVNLGPSVEVMARAENLEAHAQAIGIRLNHLARQKSADTGESDRIARVHRQTNETDIRVRLNLDGRGLRDIKTGLGFFDHLLDQLARHSRCDMTLRTHGDLHIDEHHTIEDTALALGQAFDQALGDKRGLERYGFSLPMDDALAEASIDFSGRPWLVWEADFKRDAVGDVPTEMFYHFFKSFCDAARCNLNLRITGDNEHHKIEAAFKAVGRSIRLAVRRNQHDQEIPSTKGIL